MSLAKTGWALTEAHAVQDLRLRRSARRRPDAMNRMAGVLRESLLGPGLAAVAFRVGVPMALAFALVRLAKHFIA